MFRSMGVWTVAFVTLAALACGLPAAAADEAKCLFVSSYHQGYAWSDGVERGLRKTLEGGCQLRQFDMDTKRKKSVEDKKAAANEAKALIESWQPDIVITADDNAAKFLIQPYFKDKDLPFVLISSRHLKWRIRKGISIPELNENIDRGTRNVE